VLGLDALSVVWVLLDRTRRRPWTNTEYPQQVPSRFISSLSTYLLSKWFCRPFISKIYSIKKYYRLYLVLLLQIIVVNNFVVSASRQKNTGWKSWSIWDWACSPLRLGGIRFQLQQYFIKNSYFQRKKPPRSLLPPGSLISIDLYVPEQSHAVMHYSVALYIRPYNIPHVIYPGPTRQQSYNYIILYYIMICYIIL
jgi:hypothetical protein